MLRTIFYCTICAVLLLAMACLHAPLFASESALDLSIEELMTVEVTSASKKPQQLKDIPAAVHIISAEDIRRSGATNIPEALRLAPGVQVLALSNNRWSISIRGAAREYVNKLLVLVDGRSVYTPTFSGLMWETLEVPLENILRIEVIRGAGASIWGSNAVNGVINIITMPATETPGGYFSASGGDLVKGSAFIRYGYKSRPDTSVSVYSRGFEVGKSRQINGQNGEDIWNNRSIGFRLDRTEGSSLRKFMVQGNAFLSRADDQATMYARPPEIVDVLYTQRVEGLNFTARWENEIRNRKTSLQSSFEAITLKHVLFDESRSTFDLEYTERFNYHTKHDLVWGAATRISQDVIDSSRFMRLADSSKISPLFRVFVNDDITVCPEKLKLSLSAGFDHNQYSGFEFQPSARLMYTPDKKNSFWAAVSKASRIPTRIERGVDYYFQAGVIPGRSYVVDTSLTELDSEKLIAYELGWRRKIHRNLSADLAGFYFKYSDAAGSHQSSVARDPAGYLVINRILDNYTEADFRGAELTLDWNPVKKWHLQGMYSFMNINLAIPAGSVPLDVNKNVPGLMYSVLSTLEMGRNVNWNVWFRHVGAIEIGNLPDYDVVDSNFSWRASEKVTFSLAVQNLFDKRHQETTPRFLFSKQREFGRSIYLKAECSF